VVTESNDGRWYGEVTGSRQSYGWGVEEAEESWKASQGRKRLKTTECATHGGRGHTLARSNEYEND
jgi:hypothetical protein